MQDNNNLKKKIKVGYPQLIKQAIDSGDASGAAYWQRELEVTKHRLETRTKNKKKNLKQQRKNGNS